MLLLINCFGNNFGSVRDYMKKAGDTKLNLKALSIEGDGFHLYINAKINGYKVHLLVDTGASKTAFYSIRIVNFSDDKLVAFDRLKV